MSAWNSTIGFLLAAVMAVLIGGITPNELGSMRVFAFLGAAALIFLAFARFIMDRAYFRVRRQNRALADEWSKLADEMFAEIQSSPITRPSSFAKKPNRTPEENREAWLRAVDESHAVTLEFRYRVERRFAARITVARAQFEANGLADKSVRIGLAHWSTNTLTIHEAATHIAAVALNFRKSNGGDEAS